jgi:Tannase and feruloyl esterase
MNKQFVDVALLAVFGIGVVQSAACGGSEPAANAQPACNDELKTLDVGAGATITLVKAFKRGDPLSLGQVQGAPMTASADMCLVKLIVGPGNPGPADAPSTSAGIGIEVWLPTPASWNQRYQAIGGGGWQGGPEFTSLTAIGSIVEGAPPFAVIRATEGFATSTTDTGHGLFQTGAFAMNPDGSFNQTLFADFAERSVHEMVLETKALIAAYYGRPAKYSYWWGCSTGGRQGLMEAQRHPEDFDGVLAAAPAINWDRAVVAVVWPQIVMQQDLGGPMASAKLAAVTAAATAACGHALTGVDDGYISDPSACRYDPSKDQELLCVAAGGSSTSASCLTLAEANAINKIWFGPTTDGAAPPPAMNNGWGAGAALGVGQLWYGLARGTPLDNLAGASAFAIGTDQVALSLLDPSYAGPSFLNATGNGTDNWRTIGYTGPVSMSAVLAQSGQRFHDIIGTDDPDLSAFHARGGKLIMWHGTRDSLLFPQGSISYYERVAAQVGGYAATQQFARFYLAPGVDHCIPVGVNAPFVGDIPDPGDQSGTTLASLLEGWVENGKAPEQLTATSLPGFTPVRTRPWCLYPTKLTYVSGDVNTGTFTCR